MFVYVRCDVHYVCVWFCFASGFSDRSKVAEIEGPMLSVHIRHETISAVNMCPGRCGAQTIEIRLLASNKKNTTTIGSNIMCCIEEQKINHSTSQH